MSRKPPPVEQLDLFGAYGPSDVHTPEAQATIEAGKKLAKLEREIAGDLPMPPIHGRPHSRCVALYPDPVARPFPLCAAEAEIDSLVNPLSYLGFVTASKRAVCAACLALHGAQRVLKGETFYRYVWKPKGPETALAGDHECSECGASFEGVSIA